MSVADPLPSSQQARPLDVEGASVALSAGAGCGKTAVLTARFLRDLEGPRPRPLGEIVALTFTEKAARELRKRIRKRCRDRLDAGEDPGRWRAVLRGLEAAPIGTFHEFCGAWLRRHAVEAAIDPDFVILDATIAGAIRDEALMRCVRQWLAARDADLIELAVEFGLTRARQAVADLMGERSAGRLGEWDGRTPEEVVAVWRDAWQRLGRGALLDGVAQAARPCLELLGRYEPTHATMRGRRAFLLEHLPDLEGLVEREGSLASVGEHAVVRGGGTKAHWPSPEVYEAVRASLEALRLAIKKYEAKSRWDEAATLEAAAHGLRLARLVMRARRAYDDAKRARGGLDFDDLLTLTRNLLHARGTPDEAADRPDEAIARLLVDEFQDTDPVQADILRHLAGAGTHAGRLFLVGDSKQSIYRFRGARPQIFGEFREAFPEAGRHALTENFRSAPAVLDFVNALFAAAFPAPEPALVPRVDWQGSDAQPAVEFLWAAAPQQGPGPNPSIHERRRLEARWLARRLRQRIEAGWPVRDRASGRVRDATDGDVAFLFRAMTDVGPYEAALADEGFEHHTIGGAAFYVQQEVNDLINVLSAIEDPLDPVAVAGALRSPFFCVSDDGLYWLATAPGGLVAGLLGAGALAGLSDLDRRRAVRASELLGRWRGLKDRAPIATLVDRVLAESGYEAALLGESLGARKRANARKLVRMARRFDQQGGFTLAAFVARLRADLRHPPREEQAATTDEEGRSVRLLSIHQAKGLEFPIVVLPDLNRRSPPRLDTVAFHPDLGPLVRPSRDPGTEAADGDDDGTRQSLGWLTYQAIEQREEDLEALRLFYVAATRARDALIVSAALDPSEKVTSPAMALLDDRFDRVTGRCRAELPEGWRAPRVHVTRECPEPGPTAEPGRRTTRWLPLSEAADAIEQAPAVEDAPPAAAPRPPRLVDLDPAAGLAAVRARVDRLTRRVLADPRVFRTRDWPRLAAELARRHDPLLPPRSVGLVVDRLAPWVDGAFGRALAGARSLDCELAWSMAWPPEAHDATVFRGTIDLLARDGDGGAQVVLFSDADAPAARERLRLLLSCRAAEHLELGAVRQAWRIRLGPGGGLEGEESWSEPVIDEAIRAIFSGPSL